jgi:predicted P-loop ATPase
MNEYVISVGQSRTSREWKNKATTWERLVQRLSKCKHTGETAAEYKAMTKTAQGKVKDVGGFVGGTVRDGGARKADTITARSLVTLDIDFGEKSTVGLVEDMLSGTAWCLYSTHSHTPDKPRYRLVMPLSREVSPDEYIPIARRLADDIGIDLFDSSTYEPSRLMYWPSAPADVEYVFATGEGDPVDADRVLSSYTDWRNPVEWPLDKRTSKVILRKPGTKQEDPTEKGGVIGAFCRTYSITEAIEAFIPGVYVPTDKPDRWTYAQGSTSGGAIIYDDGRFLFSHHGTDPCCEKTVNAFDLVRIHLYGAEDEGADINTPVNRLPSFLHMERTAMADRKVSGLMAREKLRSIQEDFGEDLADPEDNGWMEELKMDEKRKNFLPSPYNFGLILRNDPALKGSVALDRFAGRTVLMRDLPWRKKSVDPFWNNTDDAGLIEYVNTHYDLAGKTALLDASEIAFSQVGFHPVQDYLNGLEWDGKERLDTLVIDYLGAEDDELTRAMTRKHFVAAVARVMRPGCKYDYVLTLIGPEGSGKSTLVRLMGRDDWFTDSLTSIEGKEAMEQLRGKWLIEMGELTNYKKSTSEAYKAFLSKQDDFYRPAYGRKAETYRRQCVFFATTNEKAFLKGDTGNRRFWVVECGVAPAVKDPWEDLPEEVDQVWAEAVVRWKAGERLFIPREMEQLARERQEAHNELAADERVGLIDAYIHTLLPETWDNLTREQRATWYQTGSQLGHDDMPMHRRETVCTLEVMVECLGMKADDKTRYKTKEINQILRSMDCLEYEGRSYDPVYGRQRRYRILYDEDIE